MISARQCKEIRLAALRLLPGLIRTFITFRGSRKQKLSGIKRSQIMPDPSLKKYIRFLLQEEQGGCWFIEQILKDGGLQDSQEIEQAVHLAKSMENKSPAQCAKLRGDRFLQSGRYRDALWEYRSALEEETDVFFQGFPVPATGKVFHYKSFLPPPLHSDTDNNIILQRNTN